MAAYRVAVVNEQKRPLADVVVEAVSLNSWPTVSATDTTGREGVATFTGLTGPHFFRPRARRTSATVGGRVYTGDVEVQVISLGESMNVDYVYDPDGLGTHTTVAAVVAAAIAATGNKTIWLCKSATIGDIGIGGLGSSDDITIASHSQHTVILTADTNKDMFIQGSTGGNTDGGLHFINVGFSIPSANYAIYNVNTTSEIRRLRFNQCEFNGQYIARQDGNDSLGQLSIEIRDCTGTLAGFYDVAGASATYGPDQLRVYGGSLALTDLWDGGATNAAPDRTNMSDSLLVLTNGITFPDGTTEQTFSNLYIAFAAASAIFTTAAAAVSIEDLSFQNITIRFSNAAGTFCSLGSGAVNNCDGLFFDGIYGYMANGVGAGGTFITVDTDWNNVYVGAHFGKDFTTQYSGPAGGPGSHALLDGNIHSDTAADAVTRGSLIVGNATPAWDELVTGAVGTVLITDGTDPSWSGSPALLGTLTVDTINEYTVAAGVTVEGVLLRDSDITIPTSNLLYFRDTDLKIYSGSDGVLTIASDNVVDITATSIQLNGVAEVDVINEYSGGTGVTVEGVLLKDSFGQLPEIATPANPPQNYLRLFSRASGDSIQLVMLSSTGQEHIIHTLLDGVALPAKKMLLLGVKPSA